MLILSPISSEKVVKYWETAKLNSDTYMFPTFYFLLQSSDFIIGHKYCQLFSLKWQVHLLIFEKISAWYPNLNKHCYLSIVQVKKKKAALNSNNSNLVLFLEKPPYFSMQQSCSVYSHLITQNIKKIYTSVCDNGY